MFFYLSYLLNAIACFMAAGLLLFLKPLRQSSNRKYKTACFTLSGATAIVGIGHLLTVLFNSESLLLLGMFSFPFIVISASQALMFTFLLIVLFRESYVTAKTILLHALPSVVLSVLYLLSCLVWDDVVVTSPQQWRAHLDSPPLLIRSLFGLAYLVQLAVYTYVFFRERYIYRQELDHLAQIPERLELRWVTRSFLSALGIGVLAFTLFIFLSELYELIVTSVFSAFYLVLAVLYVNYFYTYETLRANLVKVGAEEPDDKKGTRLDTMLASLARVQANEDNLFVRVQKLMETERPYLNPGFNRNQLVHLLYTNERYLSGAIQEATGLTVQNFITRLRINHACAELHNPHNPHTIAQIAAESGFSSMRTFNRLFREATGLTPGEYRKQKKCEL